MIYTNSQAMDLCSLKNSFEENLFHKAAQKYFMLSNENSLDQYEIFIIFLETASFTNEFLCSSSYQFSCSNILIGH